MKVIEIILDQYRDETTDPNEVQRAKEDGPLYIHGEGSLRIPHDGYVDEKLQLTFKLIGWPAKFKNPNKTSKRGQVGRQDIPQDIEEYLENFLGKAYQFNFKDHPNKNAQTIARRAGLAVWLKPIVGSKLIQLRRELNTRTDAGMGNLQALNDLLFATAKPAEEEAVISEEPKHERWSIDDI